MLILFLLVFGLLAGWLAQLVLGRDSRNYAQDLVVGLVGSFVGGLLISLLSGDGLGIHPSGLIGSVVGAIILLAVMGAVERRRPTTKPGKQQAKRRR